MKMTMMVSSYDDHDDGENCACSDNDDEDVEEDDKYEDGVEHHNDDEDVDGEEWTALPTAEISPQKFKLVKNEIRERRMGS